MDKMSALAFTQKQLDKIDSDDFNLEIWKTSFVSFLNRIFGPGNYYSNLIQHLTYEEKVSYEELYPKKVKDIELSKSVFKSATNEIIGQLELMDETEFEKTGHSEGEGKETVEAVRTALKNSLTGHQIKILKQIVTGKEKAKQKELLLEHIRKWDTTVTDQMLTDILSAKEIWNEL